MSDALEFTDKGITVQKFDGKAEFELREFELRSVTGRGAVFSISQEISEDQREELIQFLQSDGE